MILKYEKIIINIEIWNDYNNIHTLSGQYYELPCII